MPAPVAILAFVFLCAALPAGPAASAEAVWKDGADFTRPRPGVSTTPLHIGTAVRPGVAGVRLARRPDPLTALGEEGGLKKEGADLQSFALASAPSIGRSLAVWVEGDEVRSLCFDDSGQPLTGAAQRVAAAGTGKGRAAVAWSAKSKRWLAVWQELRAGGLAVTGRFLDVKGAPVGRDFVLSYGGTPYNPAVVCSDASGVCLVAWQDSVGGDWDIRGRRVGEDGVPKEGRDFPICAVPGTQYNPAVAWTPVGDSYLVVWDDQRDGQGDIYGLPLGADGSARGPERNVSASPGTETHPTARWLDAAGRFLVVWEDSRSPAVSVWARTLSPAGETGPEVPVSVGAANRLRPQVMADEQAARWIVVWLDARISINNWAVYARPVGVQGEPGEEALLSSEPALTGSVGSTWNPQAAEGLAFWARNAGAGRGAAAWRRFAGRHLEDGSVAGLRVDGGSPTTRWGRVRWEGLFPKGTEARVRARSAPTEEALAAASWSGFLSASPGEAGVPSNRWLELELRLSSESGAATPVVERLSVDYSRR